MKRKKNRSDLKSHNQKIISNNLRKGLDQLTLEQERTLVRINGGDTRLSITKFSKETISNKEAKRNTRAISKDIQITSNSYVNKNDLDKVLNNYIKPRSLYKRKGVYKVYSKT
jgi:hypothetical protein